MNVQVHTLDEVVEVVKPPRSSPGELSASTFVIRGASVGLTTTLHVSSSDLVIARNQQATLAAGIEYYSGTAPYVWNVSIILKAM